MSGLLKTIRRIVHRYASIGLEDLAGTEKSKRYAFSVVCLIGAASALVYAAFYALYDFHGLRLAWLTALACTLILVLPRIARIDIRLALLAGVLLIVLVFSHLTYHLGAATGLPLYLLIGILALVLALGTDDLVFTISMTVVLVVAMLANFAFFAEPSGATSSDPDLQWLVFVSVIVNLGVILSAGVLTMSIRVTRAEAALAAEHARSEALLDNLLPTQIAARLKSAPGQIIADDLPEVTILFADIVDFTPRASSMAADDLVRFLNRVFTEFDELTEKLGLEKIKTIGDAYMVAAGMPSPRPDHAEVIADMALAMLDVTARLTREVGQQIEVRIGLHTGSAIAGVIGTQKVFYDVWGDTVNTASRMESQGDVGRIQLTQEMKDRLGDAYTFESRGLVDIKGKGEIETFWLIGKTSR